MMCPLIIAGRGREFRRAIGLFMRWPHGLRAALPMHQFTSVHRLTTHL